MLGVTKAEAYFAFSGDDVQYGIEADRRSKILKSFVRNTYSYHLSEILATIINEYTDWEKPVQHPINIRYVLPLVGIVYSMVFEFKNFQSILVIHEKIHF